MRPLQRLLLLPALLPLLASLGLAVLNPTPPVRLRMLVWRSGAWPLGLWIGGAGAAGALVSGTALLGLTATRPRPLRRRLQRPFPPRERPEPAPSRVRDDVAPEAWGGPAAEPWEAPPSEPGEAPTIAVPFRVLRRGPEAQRASGPVAAAVAEPDGRDAQDNDWEAQPGEQW